MNEPPKYMTKKAKMRHFEKRQEVGKLAHSNMKAIEEYGENEISAGRVEYGGQLDEVAYALANFLNAFA
jgi:hypothetical protein